MNLPAPPKALICPRCRLEWMQSCLPEGQRFELRELREGPLAGWLRTVVVSPEGEEPFYVYFQG